MLSLPGYRITSGIYESVNSLVYRGVRELDLQPLVFKVLKPNYPTPDELTRYRQEYAITRSLNLEGVIKVYGIEAHQNSLVMILEDFGGESLRKHLIARSFSLEEVLILGIQLAEILGQVHQQQVIHKDINPSNIVWNPATKQLKLIDFGIASRITRETPTLRSPNVLEGTIAYMSPEQTGRMNRSLDYRTDFYSLGATFYELLTQQLPFTADDALELVHCHLAKRPVPPCEITPAIPQAVSDIVMKLLAKTAEDRYQSYRGIQVDLEICLTQIQATHHISAFPLAQQDSSDCFQIPQKLYGRDREVEKLIAAFETSVRASVKTASATSVKTMVMTTLERATETQQPSPTPPNSRLMLISGYSGIGKTSLVQEIYRPITQQRGYFITGKFDQYQRDIPYSAFVSAFSTWVEQVLTEPKAQLNHWRDTLLAALEPNASVLIEMIPELELIVGQQPPVPDLPPSEARNRLNRVLQQFIQVVAQPNHPLVIFLDDLQWVDRASLQVIQVLMTTAVPCLFLIGAYRDNEVSATHPLIQSIEEMQKAGTPLETIALSPLQKADIQQLLADTLNCSADTVARLADLVLVKTNGNPFFVNEFLRALYVEHLLTFNYHHSRWEWSIADIQQRNITDNVVELLVAKIQRLEQTTQDGLRRAACIGNQFDLQTLTFVLHSAGVLNEPSPSATLALLKEAVNLGLIIPLNDSYKRIELDIFQASDAERMEYKFAHDRIQQAAYSLNSDAERLLVHRQIGQQLLQNTPPHQQAQKLFDIVNHLNLSQALVETQAEREHLAQLNLLGGKKAKISTAYTAAVNYLTTARSLLSEKCWQDQYDLSLNIFIEAAEAEYLNTNFTAASTLAEIVLQQTTVVLDRVKAHELEMLIQIAQSRFSDAVDIGLQALELLGYPIPTDLSNHSFLVDLPSLEQLEDYPTMTDPAQLAALRILRACLSAVFGGRPDILLPVILTQVKLCIDHGHSPLAAGAYVWYGVILCSGMGDIDRGYQAGQLALKLLAQFDSREYKALVHNMFYSFIQHWKEPLQASLSPLAEGVQSGLETGDSEYAGYCANNYCIYQFLIGENLATVEQIQGKYHTLLLTLRLGHSIVLSQILHQLILNLSGKAADPQRLIGESFDESVMLPRLQAENNHYALFVSYLAKTMLFYLLGEFVQAVDSAAEAENHSSAGAGAEYFVTLNFYQSLALLANYAHANAENQAHYWAHITANQHQLHLWATHAPMNYLHKWHLVEAERHRVLGEQAEAIAHYDRAAKLAKKHDYLHEKALTYERTALFYLEQGKEIIARAYLQEARYCYLKWGATAKVRDLEDRYSELLRQTSVPKTMRSSSRETVIAAHPNVSLTTTDSSDSETLDLATVIKASQVLSGELNVDKLLTQLMTLVLQNAGAQTGTLLLEADRQLRIEATGMVDPAVVVVQPSIPLDDSDQLPLSLIQYVARRQQTVILEDALQETRFASDRYIQAHHPKSVLCAPIQGHGNLLGIVYLENNLTTNAFTPDRATILQVLTAQAAIALENAKLYQRLEVYSHTLETNNRILNQEVSDRRRAEDQLRQSLAEREILLKEIHHRVKNNLQIISGLLQLQSQSVTDAATIDILRESQHRIESMSLIHKKLYSSSDFGEIDQADYIPSLASSLLASYQITPGRVALHMEIAPVLLNIDQAIPCGLIVNELVSNALKYAFPDDRQGEIYIHLHVLSGNQSGHQSDNQLGNQVELTIRDNGIGLPETVDWEYAQSLGLSLVHDLAVEQLDGSLTVERHPGTTFKIQFSPTPLLNSRLMVKG